MAKKTQEIVYIDRDGLYGDASGLLILCISDLGKGGAQDWQEAKDTEKSLLAWANKKLEANRVFQTQHLVSESGRIFHAALSKSQKGRRKKLMKDLKAATK